MKRKKKRLVPRRSPRPVPIEHLTVENILNWSDAFHDRTGQWPKKNSGDVAGVAGVDWGQVDHFLRRRALGRAGGLSLARLLFERRGVKNKQAMPKLTRKLILQWVDAHYERTGEMPTVRSGAIVDAPHETWAGVHTALSKGGRGLPGGYSLPRLLVETRGVRNKNLRPKLTEAEILQWADSYRETMGKWPTAKSGLIKEQPDESWRAVDLALRTGLRGLPGGASLIRLLAARRGARNDKQRPRLTIQQILAWADAHYERTLKWPKASSGAVEDAWDEDWRNLNDALWAGQRGLPGGQTLAQVLEEHRKVRNLGNLPRLTEEQILSWADAHYRRTGKWPAVLSGWIPGSWGEKWIGVENALRLGLRGMPGGSSLHRFIKARRPEGVPPQAGPRGRQADGSGASRAFP